MTKSEKVENFISSDTDTYINTFTFTQSNANKAVVLEMNIKSFMRHFFFEASKEELQQFYNEIERAYKDLDNSRTIKHFARDIEQVRDLFKNI